MLFSWNLGLYDTVFDVDNDKERAQAAGVEPNGFNFDGADAAGIDYALNRYSHLIKKLICDICLSIHWFYYFR